MVEQAAPDLGLAGAGQTQANITDWFLRLGPAEQVIAAAKPRSPCPARTPSTSGRVPDCAAFPCRQRAASRRNACDLGDDPPRRATLRSSGACSQAACEAPASSIASRLVRRLAVVDVFRRQLDRRADRLVGLADLVMLLVVQLRAGILMLSSMFGSFTSIFWKRTSARSFRIVAEFLIRRAADAAQVADARAGLGWTHPSRRRVAPARSPCGFRR